MSNKMVHQLYAEHQGKVFDMWSLYLPEYDRLFDDYRDKPIRLLEIGIQNGGSLEIWLKYFSKASAVIRNARTTGMKMILFSKQRKPMIKKFLSGKRFQIDLCKGCAGYYE